MVFLVPYGIVSAVLCSVVCKNVLELFNGI